MVSTGEKENEATVYKNTWKVQLFMTISGKRWQGSGAN
jgi:hypothetical protein